MTDNQEKLIIACLLGKGYLTKHRLNRANPKLEIQHSEQQLEYLEWKKSLLIKNGLKVSNIYKINRNGYSVYKIVVDLNKEDGINLRHRFYPNGNKTVTRHELNKLNELGLAIWFMDDGCKRVAWDDKKNKCVGRSLNLATYSFTKEENEIIQKYFDSVWNVKWNIRRDGIYPYLSMNATNAKIFIPLISDYIIDSLKYKIDLKYKNPT